MGLAAAARRGDEAVAELDALHRLDAHERLGEEAVDAAVPVDVGAEPGGDAVPEDLDDTAERVAGRGGGLDLGDHRRPRRRGRSSAPARRRPSRGRRAWVGARRRHGRAERDDVAEHLDAELAEQRLGERSRRRRGRRSRGRSPRSRTSRASSKPYFCMPTRSACPGRGWLERLLGAARRGRHLLLPLRPLGVADDDRDRGAEGAAVADAAEELELVLLEAHPRPAPEPQAPTARARRPTSSTVIGSPAGSPSTMTTRAGPWDSPAVRKRSTRNSFGRAPDAALDGGRYPQDTGGSSALPGWFSRAGGRSARRGARSSVPSGEERPVGEGRVVAEPACREPGEREHGGEHGAEAEAGEHRVDRLPAEREAEHRGEGHVAAAERGRVREPEDGEHDERGDGAQHGADERVAVAGRCGRERRRARAPHTERDARCGAAAAGSGGPRRSARRGPRRRRDGRAAATPRRSWPRARPSTPAVTSIIGGPHPLCEHGRRDRERARPPRCGRPRSARRRREPHPDERARHRAPGDERRGHETAARIASSGRGPAREPGERPRRLVDEHPEAVQRPRPLGGRGGEQRGLGGRVHRVDHDLPGVQAHRRRRAVPRRTSRAASRSPPRRRRDRVVERVERHGASPRARARRRRGRVGRGGPPRSPGSRPHRACGRSRVPRPRRPGPAPAPRARRRPRAPRRRTRRRRSSRRPAALPERRRCSPRRARRRPA